MNHLSNEVRTLPLEQVDGEVSIVIDYAAGRTVAKDVLQGAMNLIDALDKLDKTLLSSIDSSLEPVSILNDVQHSSLKILLARALKKAPDELIANADWKKWIGFLLVKGKHMLLQKIDADTPEISAALHELEANYQSAPQMLGYETPSITEVREALDQVAAARASLQNETVTVQTELGDIRLANTALRAENTLSEVDESLTQRNQGIELFKVKAPDMLGHAQWKVMRANRQTWVTIMHEKWLEDYHARNISLQPGDSLRAKYEEEISYDSAGNELERKICLIEILNIISPPQQTTLPL